MRCVLEFPLVVVLVSWVVSTEASKGFGRPFKILEKDVAIIGGGGSGAYSAVRLREDLGLSVVVIEKQDKLVRRAS
jgi:ribulose 1,5-bisphosphate synthetase/thiazole synthase